MDRRNFIRLATAGSTIGIIAPKTILASSSPSVVGAGGLFYTKDAPGRWSAKVGSHLPDIDVSKSGGETSLQIVTPHGMEGYDHYIVKHLLLDKDFKFIDEKMFDPMKEKLPVSNFVLGNYQGVVNVLSVCNEHDSWLNTIEV